MSKINSSASFDRRHFFRSACIGFGLLAATPLVLAANPTGTPQPATNKQYRAISGGVLQVSSDGGLTWRQAAKFAANFEITYIDSSNQNRLRIYLRNPQYIGFWLYSTDGEHWRAH